MINTGQQKKCQSLKISYFPNFGALIPNNFQIYGGDFAVLPVLRFFGRKLHFQKYFEILKKN